MNGPVYGGLDVTFPTAETTVLADRVMVLGTNGNAALPGGAAAAKVLGVTLDAFQTGTGSVPLRIQGITWVTSDGSGAIDEGDSLYVADTGGKVKTVTDAFAGTLASRVGMALTPAAATADLKVLCLLQIGVTKP